MLQGVPESLPQPPKNDVPRIRNCRQTQTTMGFAEVWGSHPKTNTKGGRSCRVCGNQHGLIRKYGLNVCRQCFREYAKDIGFIKYR